jgi:hypothetical protein
MRVFLQDLLVLIPFLPALVAWVSFTADEPKEAPNQTLQPRELTVAAHESR